MHKLIKYLGSGGLIKYLGSGGLLTCSTQNLNRAVKARCRRGSERGWLVAEQGATRSVWLSDTTKSNGELVQNPTNQPMGSGSKTLKPFLTCESAEPNPLGDPSKFNAKSWQMNCYQTLLSKSTNRLNINTS
jgi:hypothetical protein